jgi:S-adenosylmethionine hydrolase
MKGVILQINPRVQLIDVTHDIAPFSVLEGALVLKGISRYFPDGTIHVAVVDPGVGSARRAMVLRAGNQVFVGPDNGLFSLVIASAEAWEAREIQNPQYTLAEPHPSFHGRDVFAPVAAHLSLDKSLETVGPRLLDPALLSIPAPSIVADGIEGEVIYIDRFGNLSTNIESGMLLRPVKTIHVRDRAIVGLSRFFSQVAEGEPLALINSFGLIEIAVNRGDASKALGIGYGTAAKIEFSYE